MISSFGVLIITFNNMTLMPLRMCNVAHDLFDTLSS
jgi:hypothetical protein